MSARPTTCGSPAARPMSTSGRFVSLAPGEGNGRFSVDVVGLLEALTEQFPDPLLCVRELIQNAADAGAESIQVDISFDEQRQLVRLSVLDDGRGMSLPEVEGYLTIGFSQKDPTHDRGRFGIGKLSPYALGFSQMIVETSDGEETHCIEFRSDGSGMLSAMPVREPGTKVSIYKVASREQAEELSERTYALVSDSCGFISTPLFVNNIAVNHDAELPTPYVVRFDEASGRGTLGVCSELSCNLLSGGIVLEVGAAILGAEVSYILDTPQLSPTLSRNAVRRDVAFTELLRTARAQLPQLVHVASQILSDRVGQFRQIGSVVERALDLNDRAALEWLRAQLLQTSSGAVNQALASAPVLETADGDLVSLERLMQVSQRERHLPVSRVPRSPDEIAGYIDRGVPVLLLYRDLEDFLQRQSIPTTEVDGWDAGVEHRVSEWTDGEKALLSRARSVWRSSHRRKFSAVVASVLLLWVVGHAGWQKLSGNPFLYCPVQSLVTGETFVSDRGIFASESVETNKRVSTKPSLLQTADSIPAVSRSVVVLATAMICLGAVVLVMEFFRRRQLMMGLHASKARLPVVWGDGRQRRLELFLRMFRHPIDFLVARGWPHRAGQNHRIIIAGYRAFAPEAPVRTGARLDLDRLELGYIDLSSGKGEPSDARFTIQRDGRVLLNRNHPTIKNLIRIADVDPPRAWLLLDALLATDPELAKGCDPRQIEWDLVGRAPRIMREHAP